MASFDKLKPPTASSAGSVADAQKSLDKAKSSKDRSAEAASLVSLALGLGQEGKPQEAVARGIEALDICQDLKKQVGQAQAFFALARAHFIQGDLADAQQKAARAVQLFSGGDQAWQEASARLLLAITTARAGGAVATAFVAEAQLGKAGEALRTRRSAQEAAEAFQSSVLGHREMLLRQEEARSYTTRGDHEGALGQIADATFLAAENGVCAHHRRLDMGVGLTAAVKAAVASSLEIVNKKAKTKPQQAEAALAEASATVLQGGAIEDAIKSAESGLELAKAGGDGPTELAALSTLAKLEAIVAQQLGMPKEKALQRAKEALELSRKLSSSKDEVSSLCLCASLQVTSAEATAFVQDALKAAGQDPGSKAEALVSAAQAPLLRGGSLSDAASREALDAFKELGDLAGEVAAQSMSSYSSALQGESRQALSRAKEAWATARALDARGQEVTALQALIFASLAAGAGEAREALQAGRELVKVCRYFEDQTAEAWALEQLARLHLANGDPGQAVRSAEEAIAAAPDGVAAQAAALCCLCHIHACRGKPAAALRAAEKLLELPARGSNILAPGRKGEALALIVASEANRCCTAAVGFAKDAQTIMGQIQDKAGEAAAAFGLAQVLLSQPRRQLDGALGAATDASTKFKNSGHDYGEAVAQCSLATILLLKEEASEAEKAGQQALLLFKSYDAKAGISKSSSSPGEARARQILSHSKLASLQPSSAKLFFDQFNVAHLEINELASQDSLEAAVATLHNMQRNRKNVKAVVVHLEGTPGPVGLQSYALTSGAFIVGLRSIAVPLVMAGSGKISGSSWNLALACDYRVADLDAEFQLPILAPPECLSSLVGPAVAAELCISTGTLSAQVIQEMGILHQVRPGKDETSRAAAELAKRIASYPGVACRQTMSLLTPPPITYAAVGYQKMPDPALSY